MFIKLQEKAKSKSVAATQINTKFEVGNVVAIPVKDLLENA